MLHLARLIWASGMHSSGGVGRAGSELSFIRLVAGAFQYRAEVARRQNGGKQLSLF